MSSVFQIPCNFFYSNQKLSLLLLRRFVHDSISSTIEKYLKKVLNIMAELKVNCGFEQVTHCIFCFVTLLEFLVKRFSIRFQFSNCKILGTYLTDSPIVRYQPPLPPLKNPGSAPASYNLGGATDFFMLVFEDVSKPSCAS